jgi:hypothetical protein
MYVVLLDCLRQVQAAVGVNGKVGSPKCSYVRSEPDIRNPISINDINTAITTTAIVLLTPAGR